MISGLTRSPSAEKTTTPNPRPFWNGAESHEQFDPTHEPGGHPEIEQNEVGTGARQSVERVCGEFLLLDDQASLAESVGIQVADRIIIFYVEHVSAHEQPPPYGPTRDVVWGWPMATSATSGVS